MGLITVSARSRPSAPRHDRQGFLESGHNLASRLWSAEPNFAGPSYSYRSANVRSLQTRTLKLGSSYRAVSRKINFTRSNSKNSRFESLLSYLIPTSGSRPNNLISLLKSERPTVYELSFRANPNNGSAPSYSRSAREPSNLTPQ